MNLITLAVAKMVAWHIKFIDKESEQMWNCTIALVFPFILTHNVTPTWHNSILRINFTSKHVPRFTINLTPLDSWAPPWKYFPHPIMILLPLVRWPKLRRGSCKPVWISKKMLWNSQDNDKESDHGHRYQITSPTCRTFYWDGELSIRHLV